MFIFFDSITQWPFNKLKIDCFSGPKQVIFISLWWSLPSSFWSCTNKAVPSPATYYGINAETEFQTKVYQSLQALDFLLYFNFPIKLNKTKIHRDTLILDRRLHKPFHRKLSADAKSRGYASQKKRGKGQEKSAAIASSGSSFNIVSFNISTYVFTELIGELGVVVEGVEDYDDYYYTWIGAGW